MSYELSKPSRFVIEQARDVGFVVLEHPGLRGDGYPSPCVCAGSLAECLDYLRNHEWPLGKKPATK